MTLVCLVSVGADEALQATARALLAPTGAMVQCLLPEARSIAAHTGAACAACICCTAAAAVPRPCEEAERSILVQAGSSP